MGIYTDPAQELFLAMSLEQGNRVQRAAEQFATAGNAQNLVDYSQSYPLGSANLGLGLTISGIPGSNEGVQQLVQQELAMSPTLGAIEKPGEGWWNDIAGVWDEWVDNPIKGTTRFAFGLWDAGYNLFAGGAPVRAYQQSLLEGTDFDSAWEKQRPYMFDAIGAMFRGENVNLGSGWFPNSDVAPDVQDFVNTGMQQVERDTEALPTNEKYAARLEAAPGVWNEAVSQSAEQAALGIPLTQLARTNAESVMFDISQLGGGSVKTPWSPGRVATAFVMEPGTEGFSKVSGFGDFTTQLFADPAEWIGLGWAKWGRQGRLLFGQADKVAKNAIWDVRSPAGGYVREEAQLTGNLGLVDEAGKAVVDKPGYVKGFYGPADELPATMPREAREAAAIGEPSLWDEFDDAPVDATMVLADDMGIAVGEPAQYGEQLSMIDDFGMPDWTNPNGMGRTIGPSDPPKWYRDTVNQILEFTKRIKKGQKAVMVEKGFWTIADEAGDPIHIQRMDDGKWLVSTAEGETLSAGHRTKNAAVKSATNMFDDRKAMTTMFGMSVDEFARSGEDFNLVDGFDVLPQQGRDVMNGRAVETPLHKASAGDAAVGSNTKVRVFGKTADATVPVDSLDAGLAIALGKDKKIARGIVRGFANPNIEKWTATKAWMRENGIGKIKLGDDSYLILDEFIGGNIDDPLTRVWAPDGNKPMGSFGIDPYDAVTPNEINEVIDYIVTHGAQMTKKELRAASNVPGASADQAAAIRAASNQAQEAQAALRNVRPDFDELATTNMVTGARAGKFMERLMSTTKYGGQTTIAALDNLLRVFQKKGIPISNEFRSALFNARTENELQVIFARWLSHEAGGQVLLRGGGGNTGFGRLSMRGAIKESRFPQLKLTDKPWLARRLAYGMPSTPFNIVDDPSDAYRVLDEVLPNFNIKRGTKVQRYDNAGEIVEGSFIDVEALFDSLRGIRQGNKVGAYELMGEFAELFFSSTVNSGVDPKLAKWAKRWWGEISEEAVYEAERAGMVKLTMGSDEMMYVGGHQVHGLGPQLTAQAWDGAVHAPDPKVIRRMANESDLLGRISNRITSKRFVDESLPSGSKYGTEKLVDRAWFRFATGVMNDVWKPFVLLRAAWTVRIAIDDQARIAAEGYGALNHPFRLFQYAITMPKDWWTLFKKGSVDINGVMMNAENVSDMAHGILYQKAMMKMSNERLGAGSFGYRHSRTVGREDAKYIEGISNDIMQLRASTITKVLANSKANDPVNEVVLWLMGKSGNTARRESGMAARQELAGIYMRLSQEGDEAMNTANAYSRIMQGNDYDFMYEVVEKQWATLNHKTGGAVYLDDGSGVLRDYGNLRIREGDTAGKVAKTGKAQWVIKERGDKELMRVVAGHNDIYGDVLANEQSAKALRAGLRTKVRASEGKFPMYTRVADETVAGRPETLKETWDKGIRRLFDFFMTTPSNKLSRSPLFHRAYWDKMTELYPYMDDAMQRQMRSVANKANIRIAEKAARKADPDIVGRLTDIDQADMLAKSFALTQVESTLFTLLDTRRNISQSLNLIFPFAEAWGEFMTRWGRLMVTGDKNIANARRFQQGIEGARDSGFFHENEFGQEVFNYPAFLTKAQVGVHNTLNNLPVLGAVLGEDVSQETTEALTQGQTLNPADAGVRQQSSVTGSVESMNFASGVIPGFGPVFQIAAKSVLPDDPKWDWMRNIVSPFGQEGSVAGSLAPAWVKRVSASLGGGDDPQLNYQYASSVQDIIRTQIDSGEWAGLTSQEQVNAKVKEAEEQARGLLMVRAAATFFNPASPQFRFQKQDKTGMVWSYSNLGNEYRKILDEQQGDEAAAYEEFNARFGMLPHPFIGGRTYSVVDRARTSEGWKFQREQPVLFARYPSTAMYLDPNGGGVGEYSHDATLRQLRLSEREAWTGEQMIYLQQDQLGDLSWSNAKDIAKGYESASDRNAFLTEQRAYIEELYPLWNKPIPGKRQGYTNEQQMAEVYSWLGDPTVAGTPVTIAANQYIMEREFWLDQVRALGGKTLSSTSLTTEQGRISRIARQSLRALSLQIEQQIPEWKPLFMNVFAYEVRNELDLGEMQPDTLTDGAFGEQGDIFMQLLGATG